MSDYLDIGSILATMLALFGIGAAFVALALSDYPDDRRQAARFSLSFLAAAGPTIVLWPVFLAAGILAGLWWLVQTARGQR